MPKCGETDSCRPIGVGHLRGCISDRDIVEDYTPPRTLPETKYAKFVCPGPYGDDESEESDDDEDDEDDDYAACAAASAYAAAVAGPWYSPWTWATWGRFAFWTVWGTYSRFVKRRFKWLRRTFRCLRKVFTYRGMRRFMFSLKENFIKAYYFAVVTVYGSTYYWGILKGVTLCYLGLRLFFQVAKQMKADCGKRALCKEFKKKYPPREKSERCWQ